MCPELVTGTDGGRRQDEHVDVTVSTNGALCMLNYSAAFLLILNAGQQSGTERGPTAPPQQPAHPRPRACLLIPVLPDRAASRMRMVTMLRDKLTGAPSEAVNQGTCAGEPRAQAPGAGLMTGVENSEALSRTVVG